MAKQHTLKLFTVSILFFCTSFLTAQTEKLSFIDTAVTSIDTTILESRVLADTASIDSSLVGKQALVDTVKTVQEIRSPFDSIQTIFQKLQNYQKIVITTNLDTLIANRRKDIEQSALLQVYGTDQKEIALTIKIRPRGKFRRIKCALPPLRINFWKPDLDSLHLYRKYDKLKLVTHCNEDAIDGQTLLKEYWTYKLYNELTHKSFRVHVLEVKYVHEPNPDRTITSYAFVIENNEEVAHRLGGELIEGMGITPDKLTTESYHNALLFNYMIGNTDWQLNTQKNLKLVKYKHHTLYTLVPYDFDYAKIVDPSYLRIDYSVKNVDEDNRAAKGNFTNQYTLRENVAKFKRLRKTGFKCFKACPILQQAEKHNMSFFLNSFFQTIRSKKKFEQLFIAASD